MQSIVWSVRRRERPSERVLSILMSVLAVFFLLQGILFSRAFMLPCFCMAACRFVYGAARVRDYECTLEDGKLTIDRVSDRGRQRLHEIPLVDFEILFLSNDWTGYTDGSIMGDQVAGVMNGNWIIPTISQVADNSGKWEITTLPTLTGAEGYAANGGSSLYITANCKNPDLAKDFLAKTFGGSTKTYDAALRDGGVITCCISAGQSDVYKEGVPFFNGQPIYSDIVEMGSHVAIVEQNDYHYTCRQYIGAAIQEILMGSDVATALQNAESQLRFAMDL